MSATTGENLVVTWDNIVDTCTAWEAHARYSPGSFETVVNDHAGYVLTGATVADALATIPTLQRDDTCESVRYWYGACINLDESNATDPRLFL